MALTPMTGGERYTEKFATTLTTTFKRLGRESMMIEQQKKEILKALDRTPLNKFRQIDLNEIVLDLEDHYLVSIVERVEEYQCHEDEFKYKMEVLHMENCVFEYLFQKNKEVEFLQDLFNQVKLSLYCRFITALKNTKPKLERLKESRITIVDSNIDINEMLLSNEYDQKEEK